MERGVVGVLIPPSVEEKVSRVYCLTPLLLLNTHSLASVVNVLAFVRTYSLHIAYLYLPYSHQIHFSIGILPRVFITTFIDGG